MPTACYEFSIFELWARRGKFDDFVDKEIENLTRDKILYKINNQNTRQDVCFVQSGASGCEKGFITCFMILVLPQAVGLYCSCCAAQASKENFLKTFCKTFFTT